MEKIQCHCNLEWQTPEVVESRTEVDDPVHVSAHEVDDLTDRERRKRNRAR